MVQFIALQTNGGGAGAFNLVLFAVMIVVIWLFFLRPQAKKQKAQSKFVEEIQKGDEVVTSSGMIGKINKMEGNIVTLQVDTKTFIRITKSSISRELTENLNSGKDE
jgi:preprotein translocase subunit YajC